MRGIFLWVLVLALGGGVAAAQAEEVRLKLGDLRLKGYLAKAGESWPRGPVVLMTHGTLAHGRMEIMRTLQELLEERGISSLAINLSLGIDDRAGMYDCGIPHTHRDTDALLEIGAWKSWLEAQGAKRLVLLGHSRGANQTARYLVEHTDTPVEAAILLAPAIRDAARVGADYRERFGASLDEVLGQARSLVEAGQGDRLVEPVGFLYCEDTKATAEAILSYYDPAQMQDIPYLIADMDLPVHVIAGSEDTVAEGLVTKVEPLAAARTNVDLLVVQGAGHFFRDLHAEDVADYIAAVLEGP